MQLTAILMTLAFAEPVPPPPPTPVPAFSTVEKADRTPAPPWQEIKADAILTVLSAPEKSRWLLIDDGADLVPSADGKTATFGAIAKGRYRVVVVSPTGEAARITVVVVDSPKPPPGPVDPPLPTDPLTAKLQAAYALDKRDSAAKLADLKVLIELFVQAAEFAAAPNILSLAELIVKFREAAKTLGIVGLVELRKASADELHAAFPVDAAFDEPGRAKAKAMFVKLSEALKNVK